MCELSRFCGGEPRGTGRYLMFLTLRNMMRSREIPQVDTQEIRYRRKPPGPVRCISVLHLPAPGGVLTGPPFCCLFDYLQHLVGVFEVDLVCALFVFSISRTSRIL
eukprot:EG_transcript_7266